ncbi:MAG: HAD-IA family hydrolase, partial [Rhodobacteraceae bacterium]|nr:HAD-IA family hydrolase [Paracoccaceae bacterium]
MTAAGRRLVLFDVDGTLVDSQDHIHAAMAHAFAVTGQVMPPRDEVLSIVGLSLAEAVARLLPGGGPDEQAEVVEAYKNSFGVMRAHSLSPLFPGARAALDALAARDDLVLGVATGKSRRGLDHILAAHGLQGVFATCQVADDHPSKPHPSMVRTALAEVGADPAQSVMIGDTSFDMEMGRAAGGAARGGAGGYHP